jgi:hypothetical protein
MLCSKGVMHSMGLWRLQLLIGMVVLVSVSGARAQSAEPSELVFVVAAVGDTMPPWATAGIDELAKESEQVLGRKGMQAQEAVKRFEAAHSAEAPAARPQDIQTFKDLTKTAVGHLAEGKQAPALHELDAAFRLYDAAPDYFNREIPIDVLDGCLYMARGLLETGSSPQEIEAQLRKCRALLPRSVEPRMIRHTLVAPAWNRVLHATHEHANAELQVECLNGECMIHVNAVFVGHARPVWEATELSVSEQRVSAECLKGVAGRVHRMALKAGKNALNIDCRYETAIHSNPALHLLYTGAEALSMHRIGDAAITAAALGMPDIVLISSESSGRITLTRIAAKDSSVLAETVIEKPSTVELPWPIDVVAAALERLKQGRLDGANASAPGDGAARDGGQSLSRTAARFSPTRMGALVLGAVGAAGYLTAAALEAVAEVHRNKVHASEKYVGSGEAEKASNLAVTSATLSIPSMAFVAAALALRDESQELPRWTRYAMPAGAAVFAGLTTVEAIQASRACDHDPNDKETCGPKKNHIDRAVLFGTASFALALPSIVIPLRRRLELRAASTIQARAFHHGLQLTGSF